MLWIGLRVAAFQVGIVIWISMSSWGDKVYLGMTP